MRIATKLSLAFSLMVFVILCLCILFLISILRSSRGIDVIEEEIREWTEIAEIKTSIDAVLRSAVERIEQHQGPFDDAIKDRIAACRESIRRMKEAASTGNETPSADDEHEREETQRIGAIDDRLVVIERILAAVVDPNDASAGSAAIIALHHEAERIDDVIRQFHAQDIKEFERAFRTARRTQGQSVAISLYGAAAAILLAILLGFVFHRMIAIPLQNLQGEVKSIASGDFSRRLPVGGADEMGALARSVNDMAADLQSLYANLEEKVRERTQQLVRAEKLATVGKMAAGLAHEINNPLGPVAACAESLYERIRNGGPATSADPEETRKYLRTIVDGVYRCKAVTEALLNFSRQRPSATESVDLLRVVEETTALLEYQAKSRSASIEIETRGERPVVSADPSQMQQLVFNLINNSLDAVPPGGRILVVLDSDGATATMAIQDNGVGIPAEDLPRLFEPFFTTKPTGKGTGLGLAVCYSIVERHGGTIAASSDGAGKGSRFVVTLPMRSVRSEKR